jgi:hypothetical protein
MKKLMEAAKLYDKNDPSSLPLDELNITYMSPIEFRDQLKRLFNLKLSPPEFSAIANEFNHGAYILYIKKK